MRLQKKTLERIGQLNAILDEYHAQGYVMTPDQIDDLLTGSIEGLIGLDRATYESNLVRQKAERDMLMEAEL